jgi:hypothetical protein
MKKGEEFLGLMIEVIDDIIDSPRWKDNDTPMPGGIIELGAKINNGNQYRTIRENPDLKLLLETIENYEESLNDDWMPFEILGLKLPEAFSFIQKIRTIAKNSLIHEFDQKIKEAYKEFKP